MNANRLKLFLDRVLAAEDASGVDPALVTAHSAYSTLGQQGLNGPNRAAALDARSKFRSAAGLLRQSLSDPEGQEAVEFLKLKHYTIYLGEDVENLISQTENSPSLIAGRLVGVRSERTAIFGNLRVTAKELERLDISSSKPESGALELGFLIPRPYFRNSLGDFAEKIKQISYNIDSLSILANGKTQNPELIEINTSNPLVFIGVDPATANQVYEAYKFLIEFFRGLAEVKKALERARSLFPDAAVRDAEAKLNKQIDEKIAVEVATRLESVRLRDSNEVANDLAPRIQHAYKNIFLEIEGGVQLKLRAGISGDVNPELIQELTSLLDKASQLQFPVPPANDASRITDARDEDKS